MALSLPVLQPGATAKTAMTSTSAAASTALFQGEIIDVFADAACWVAFGRAATNGDFPIAANVHTQLRVPTRTNAPYPGQGAANIAADQINAITTTTGNIYVTPLVNQ